MALDKNDLISLVDTNIPDNTTGLVTPEKVRQVDSQIITSSANLEELALQTFKGPLSFPGQESVGYTNNGSFFSSSTQTGLLDVPTTVLFGAGGNTTDNHLTIGIDGVVTINTVGYISIKQRFRSGRVGASGVSELFFWAEVSFDDGVTWVETGNSVDVSLSNADATVVFFDISNVFLPAGTMLRNRFARSSTGNNSGDLISSAPSAALTALGVPDAPSAQITIYRIDD